MSSRQNVKQIRFVSNAGKAMVEKRRREARTGHRTKSSSIPASEWEIAASPFATRNLIFSSRGGEKKGMDTDVSLTPIIATTNTNGSAFCLNLIQNGAASWNRIGRKSHLKSLRLTGNFLFNSQPSATGSAIDNFVRMVVVWDNQISGAALPQFDAIFGITDQSGTESCPDITCPPRYDNMDRFKVLSDTIIEQPPLPIQTFAGTAATAHHVPFDKYIRLNNLESVYATNSNPMTIADLSTGALYVYFRAKNNVGGQAIVTSDGIARIRYTD